MKLIVIEGLDKSGKHTQSDIVVESLRNKGFLVAKLECPRYNTDIGQIIKKWLNKEINLNAKAFELLQSADKQSLQSELDQYEDAGIDYIVLDRYIHSQLAYGSIDNDLNWIESLIKYCRLPDYMIYLDVSVENSMRRRGEHGDNDRYESDKSRLESVRNAYMSILDSHLLSTAQIIDANQDVENVTKQVESFIDLIAK